MIFNSEFVKSFWSLVNIGLEDECWEWKRGKSGAGYGEIKVPNIARVMYAHRVAWGITHGDIPDGMHILHKCDNPPCCNPKHLFLGTQADNVQDCVKKGRRAKKIRWNIRGEKHWNSKLSDSQNDEIIRTYLKGGVLVNELARQYHVTKETIARRLRIAGVKIDSFPKSILTKEQVEEIRNEYMPGQVSMLQLAKQYGVCLTTIHNIIQCKRRFTKKGDAE